MLVAAVVAVAAFVVVAPLVVVVDAAVVVGRVEAGRAAVADYHPGCNTFDNKPPKPQHSDQLLVYLENKGNLDFKIKF